MQAVSEPIFAVTATERTRRAMVAMGTILLSATLAGAQQPVPNAPSGVQAMGGLSPALQPPTTSSLFDPYYGSIQTAPARPEVLKLSLDDALRMGLENNLGLLFAREAEAQQRAQRLQLLNILLPNISVHGDHGLHQYNLQAQGFRPGLLSQLGGLVGGGAAAGSSSASFPFIVKVNETQGIANFSQYLFNLEGYDAVRAFGHAEKAARMNSDSSRGLVVLNVGTAYLRAVAARSQVDDARALLKSDEALLYQSVERHKAGITSNLDELRARVQYQSQQQTVIASENNLAKAHIALNRAIGLAPEQEVLLTEASPYADLQALAPEEAARQALAARQDYQSLTEQLRTDEYERKAATHERLPTVIFNGNYGITGVTGLVYHDTWMATGTLSVPIFEEAKFRSDRDTAEFQLQTTRARLANLRMQIDQQLRDSLIDLRTADEVVKVAKSNQDLATTELEQATERFRAGVEDNLPTTQAQSTLAQAQTQYVTAVFQLNQARLGLARNLGLIDTGYHPEIRGGEPSSLRSTRTTAAGR